MSYGREYKTTEELLEQLNDGFETFVELMDEKFGDVLDKISDTLGDVGKEFSNTKTQKSMSSLEKFGKSLKAAPQLFILEQLMKLLEPFLMLLEPCYSKHYNLYLISLLNFLQFLKLLDSSLQNLSRLQ